MDTANLILKLSPVTTGLIIGAFIAVIFALMNSSFGKYILSPGPWGVPIFGYYPFLSKNKPQTPLTQFAKKYGDVYLINICGKVYVHLGSYKAFKEAFVTKSDYFSGRTEDLSIGMEMFKEGIFVKNGEAWRVWKKFVIQSMREIGLGSKEQLKEPILEGIENTLTEIRKSGNKEINITSMLLKQCTEIIRRLTIGDNVSEYNKQKFSDAFRKLLLPFTTFESMLSGKLARYIALRKLENKKEWYKAREDIRDVFDEIIKDHEESLDISDPKDMIDLFLREKKLKSKKKDPQLKYFTNEALTQTMAQIYGDGGFTIGSFVAFFINKLAEKPAVQEEIYSEIVSQIGKDRLPTYEDKPKLPYANSAIKEMLRMLKGFPLLPSLECTTSTTLFGVYVPKGAIALVNTEAMNYDESIYKDPENFDAKRFFLPENTQEKKDNGPMMFGVGKRACLGETLVQTELFLFTTAIVQNFKFKLANEEEILQKMNDPDYVENPIKEEYRIFATPRK